MISNRIQIFRTDRGLSRKELAALVDVNPQTIGFLERGGYTPSVELALQLARVFGVSVEAVFSLEPFPPLAAQIGAPPTTPIGDTP
ncbi:MAG: helix-turn-helix transcriptional regulator [Pseudomonadota bacterium]|jgi:DNA-binding XRE family transcriptional regulator